MKWIGMMSLIHHHPSMDEGRLEVSSGYHGDLCDVGNVMIVWSGVENEQQDLCVGV